MADTTLDIGIRGGREAKQIVDLVTQALRLLGQQNAANARQSVQSAASSKSQAESLRGVARASEESLKNQQRLLNDLKRASDVTAASSKQARAEAVAAAKTYSDAAVAAAKYFQQVARVRLKDAQRPIVTTLPSGATVTTQNTGIIAARQRELREANENVARAQALGRQQIKLAQQVGVAEEQGARKAVIAQRQVITETQRKVRANQQAAAQAETTARREAAAADRARRAYQAQAAAVDATGRVMSFVRRQVVQLVAAYAGFRAIEGFISAGIRFNQIIESSKLGIGALITAEANLEDQHGNLLTGTKALAAAQVLAADQLTKLRIAGIQTAATTEDLVTTFEEAVGAGVAVGLTLDQIRQFSVQVAQAAGAIHLPMNQLQQETRSILQGTIDRNSRIAKALLLTNAEVNLAKQQNRLADLLNEKFKAFNIAGVESVKTFGALRSNIQDAFSVLAGRATEPLFKQLRDAGQAALAAIFDFKTADIQESFKGLIDGFQGIFEQIGAGLAGAIRDAVEKVRSISQFFRENREEVKQTTASVISMVESFGRLVESIGEVVLGFGRIGEGANTIERVARTLTAVFDTLRENLVEILAILAAGKLLKTIGAIVAVVSTLRTVGAGAALGSAGGPLGTAVGGIIGLLLSANLAIKLFQGNQRAARLEAARLTTAYEDQQTAASKLAAEYVEIQRAAQQKGVTDEEQITLQARLRSVLDELGKLGGPGQTYLQFLKDAKLATEGGSQALRDQLTALRDLQAGQATTAALSEADARDRLKDIEAQRDAAQKRFEEANKKGIFGQPARAAAVQELDKLTGDAEAAKAAVDRLALQTDKLNESLQKTTDLLHPAKIRPVQTPKQPSLAAAGEPQEIKQARAQLEADKAGIERLREENRALLAEGVLDAIHNLDLQTDLDLAELDAEHRLLEARQRDLKRREDLASQALVVAQKKGKPEQVAAAKTRLAALKDEEAALEIEEQTFAAKRLRIEAEANKDRIDLTRERVEAEQDIQVESLRRQGKNLEAELLQISHETDRAIAEASRKFGSFSPEIQAQVRINIEFEAREKTIKAIKDEIQKILQTRTAEVESIRDRFAQSGKLSAEEKQDESDLIAGANKRAAQSVVGLREELERLRNMKDITVAQRDEIDLLITQLDGLNVKTQEVNQDMERLKDTAREAAERGLADFLESFGDRSKKTADVFRQAVTDIVSDIRRLAAQIVASKIIQSLFSLFGGSIPSGPSGTTTLPGGFDVGLPGRARGGVIQKMAAGGVPGRPPFGILRGGIQGKDSIPIAAMPDEGFIRREAVWHYGREFVDLVNNLQLPRPILPRRRFAGGGIVQATPATARPGSPATVEHVIGLDRDGALTFLKGPRGKDIVRGHLQTMPREAGRIIEQATKRLRP